MTKNIYFFGDYANEFSVDLHIEKAKRIVDTKDSFMYITISRLENNMGSLNDYTIILNGCITPKLLKRACDNETWAAREIIDCLKNDACKYAIKYWSFDKDEWEQNLELAYKEYLEKFLDDDEKELFGLAEAIAARLPQDAEDKITIEKLPIEISTSRYLKIDHIDNKLDNLLMHLGHGDWTTRPRIAFYKDKFSGKNLVDVVLHNKTVLVNSLTEQRKERYQKIDGKWVLCKCDDGE